jgi:hypothetical protein
VPSSPPITAAMASTGASHRSRLSLAASARRLLPLGLELVAFGHGPVDADELLAQIELFVRLAHSAASATSCWRCTILATD